MYARTGLLIVSGLLLVFALSSVFTSRESHTGDGAAAIAAAANNPDPPQRPGTVKTVEASIPPDTTIRAQVGQPIDITATSGTQDVVAIPSLGYEEAVGPGVPAQLSVIAPEAGSYPVVLSYVDKKIATLKVSDPDDVAERAQAQSSAG